MKRHRIYIYWILTLAPTLMIGVGAFALLQREQRRINERQETALQHIARQKANSFADRIRLSLDVIQSQLMAEITKLDESRIPGGLEEIGRKNPLARNVFAWSPGLGVTFPVPHRPATKEQRRFLMRYEAMYNGAEPWLHPVDGRNVAVHNLSAPGGGDRIAQRTPRSARSFSRQANSPSPQRQQILLSNQAANSYDLDNEYLQQTQTNRNLLFNPNQMRVHRQGWLPWFSGNRLHLLGWAQMEPGGPVRGVELEMMSFVSRLYAPATRAQPNTSRTGAVYCKLTDGGGRILYQEGTPPASQHPNASDPGTITIDIPIGPNLPHWMVHCSWTPPPTSPLGQSFFIVGGLLAGTFIVTILIGGSLLMWQARKDNRELMQKTSFVSNVSHELKTPLTSIRMYAELLGEKRVTDETKRDKYLNVVVAESQRLSRLVNNVLDFSRLEQGRKRYSSDNLDLNHAVDAALHNQALRLQEAGITVELQLSIADIEVNTDRDALEQVFINLIDNACKYAREGGELTVTSKTDGNIAEVAFMDRGPGIAGEHRDRIFEKFHRVDNSLTRDQDGVGLGLCIARRLLTDQGGDLIYRDRVGGGACFIIRLTRR